MRGKGSGEGRVCDIWRSIRFAIILSVCLSRAVDAGTVDSNSCIDAVPLLGTGTFSFDNTLATQDGPTHAACAEFDQPEIDHDVWFCWTADCTGDVSVETCDQTSVDTKVAVYDGCACPPSDVALLDCDDDDCALQSRVRFSAAAGSSYLLRVGTTPNASGGPGTFTIDCEGIADGAESCAGAEPLVGTGTFSFDNTLATQDGPTHAACAEFDQPEIDHDVWFCWTAECTGDVTVETCDQTSVDTKVAVYDGCTCPPTDAALLDCDDDDCTLQSRAGFSAAAGSSYLLRVGTAPNASGGPGTFTIDCEGIADGAESCVDAEPLVGTGTFSFDNTLATQDGPTHAACAEFGQPEIDHDVWFCWTADCTGDVTVETCDQTSVDTKVAVYDGCTCPPSDVGLLDCNDSGCALQTSVGFAAFLGSDYLVRIGTAPNAPGGSGTFTIDCEGIADGAESCVDAEPLVGTGTFSFDNTLATQDGPDHAACGEFDQPGIDHDVWFCWTADCTGDVTVETCNQTSVDTKIAVYDGCNCPPSDAALLDCDDDDCTLQSRARFSAAAGSDYLVRVGTAIGGSGGPGTFTIDCEGIADGAESCAGAEPLLGTGTFSFDNTLATQDGPTHAACTEFDQPEIDHDVWFCWTADCTGEVTVETCDQTSVDTKIAVYDGCTCPPSDAGLLDCNDSGCALQSTVGFSAFSGSDYLVRVGTAPNASGGPGSFAIDCSPIDECTEGTHNCDVNASCSDTVDGFICTCNQGFRGDGVTCTPDICGNGLIDGGEECDDANIVEGDGCSTACTIETDFVCAGAPSICTMTIPTVSAWGLIILSLLLLVGQKALMGSAGIRKLEG